MDGLGLLIGKIDEIFVNVAIRRKKLLKLNLYLQSLTYAEN